jgi:D-inositol-3-phosphate glycosyltransferase
VDAAPILTGRIDVPAVLPRMPCVIRGWAAGPMGSTVARVDVSISGIPIGAAGLCRLRPDVAEALGREDTELSGFELRADLLGLDLTGERAVVGAAVRFLDGTRLDLEPIPVAFSPAPSSSVITPSRHSRPRTTHCQTCKRLRILCVARSLDCGGSQLRLLDLVRHLDSTDRFDLHVLTPTDGPLRGDLELAHTTIHQHPEPPLNDATAYLQAIDALAEWAVGRFDLIFASTLTSFPAIELAQRLGLPSIWRIGEIESINTVVEWLGGCLDPVVAAHAYDGFRSASIVIFNSRTALRRHRRRSASGKFIVLEGGADIEQWDAYARTMTRDAARAEIGVPTDQTLIVCAATVWPIKGQALLLQALADVRRRHRHLACVLVGQKDVIYTDAIARLIHRLELDDCVRLPGYSEDIRLWWRAADIAACPSESESFPASVLEAMAAGVPVLASRVGDIPDLIEDGVSGWLCDPCDLASLTASLENAVQTSVEKRRGMGRTAAQRFAKHYNMQKWLSLTRNVFQEVASGTESRWLRRRLRSAERETIS